ncbi:unnamed protein product [Urochloa humidicola]
MASSSAPVNPLVGISITEKLTKANHAMWKAQVLAAARGSRLIGHLTGATAALDEEINSKVGEKETKIPNPAYEEWYARDQQILSFILSSLSKEVMTQVATKETAAQAWSAIWTMFSSQTRARAINTRLALATAHKGNQSVTEYVGKMKALGNEMAAARRPLEDDELVEYIVTGLDHEFSPIVSALAMRLDPVSVDELYSQLLAFETRMELIHGGNSNSCSSVNMAQRGGRGGNINSRGRGRGNGRNNNNSSNFNANSHQGNSNGGNGRSNNNNYGRGNSSYRGNTSNSRPICQVCYKTSYTAERCWHRFDEEYVPEERHVAAAMSTYNIDTNWLVDSGSTDHVTGDLEKLSAR